MESRGAHSSSPPSKRVKREFLTPTTSPPREVINVDDEEEDESDVQMIIKEGEDSGEQCSICLQSYTDTTLLPTCSHEFCFECILIWTEQSRKCPLCSQQIGPYVIHNIRSKYDYQKHYLPPVPTRPTSPSALAVRRAAVDVQRRRRERGWGRRERAAREEADALERAIRKRRWVYEHNLYAKHVASNPYTKYRPNPTPAQFSTSQDLISRTTAFVRRELQVWVNMDVEFLTTFVVSLMKSIDIRSESAVKLLAEFLDMDKAYVPGQRSLNAEHFAHEIYSYLRSPYKDLFVYDSVVQYDAPPNNPPPRLPDTRRSPRGRSRDDEQRHRDETNRRRQDRYPSPDESPRDIEGDHDGGYRSSQRHRDERRSRSGSRSRRKRDRSAEDDYRSPLHRTSSRNYRPTTPEHSYREYDRKGKGKARTPASIERRDHDQPPRDRSAGRLDSDVPGGGRRERSRSRARHRSPSRETEEGYSEALPALTHNDRGHDAPTSVAAQTPTTSMESTVETPRAVSTRVRPARPMLASLQAHLSKASSERGVGVIPKNATVASPAAHREAREGASPQVPAAKQVPNLPSTDPPPQLRIKGKAKETQEIQRQLLLDRLSASSSFPPSSSSSLGPSPVPSTAVGTPAESATPSTFSLSASTSALSSTLLTPLSGTSTSASGPSPAMSNSSLAVRLQLRLEAEKALLAQTRDPSRSTNTLEKGDDVGNPDRPRGSVDQTGENDDDNVKREARLRKQAQLRVRLAAAKRATPSGPAS